MNDKKRLVIIDALNLFIRNYVVNPTLDFNSGFSCMGCQIYLHYDWVAASQITINIEKYYSLFNATIDCLIEPNTVFDSSIIFNCNSNNPQFFRINER